jgi:hypothetical protein
MMLSRSEDLCTVTLLSACEFDRPKTPMARTITPSIRHEAHRPHIEAPRIDTEVSYDVRDPVSFAGVMSPAFRDEHPEAVVYVCTVHRVCGHERPRLFLYDEPFQVGVRLLRERCMASAQLRCEHSFSDDERFGEA